MRRSFFFFHCAIVETSILLCYNKNKGIQNISFGIYEKLGGEIYETHHRRSRSMDGAASAQHCPFSIHISANTAIFPPSLSVFQGTDSVGTRLYDPAYAPDLRDRYPHADQNRNIPSRRTEYFVFYGSLSGIVGTVPPATPYTKTVLALSPLQNAIPLLCAAAPRHR